MLKKEEDSECLNKRIIQVVEERGIEFICLQFVDIFGFLKNVTITPTELESALNEGVMFDGSSIYGFGKVEESDMYLVPDPNTFEIFNWKQKDYEIAQLICSVQRADNLPFEGCPRNILKKAAKEAYDLGYELNVGPEGEFFLFDLDDSNNPIYDKHDDAGYFDVNPFDRGELVRRDIIRSMKKHGFIIESSHHEVAPGQHEIDFKYDKALNTADKWIMFKQIVKDISEHHGYYASFLPKPFKNENANAMHCNQSLAKNGKNVFFDSTSENELSNVAKYYIGGLIKHAKGIAAICNPTVNSYKRLVEGYEAPTNIAWSQKNRSAFIRVPLARGNRTRVELRTPDPTANPYLVFAVMLKAGLDGIKNKIEPPDEVNGNIYNLSKDESQNKIDRYPKNLEAALNFMEQDSLVKDTLGNDAYNAFLKAKRKEWLNYEREIHNWEVDNYLKKY